MNNFLIPLLKRRRSIAAVLLSPILNSSMISSLPDNSTFTRATTATVLDQEGLIKYALSNESRFSGARRVENLLSNTSTLATQDITTIAGDYVFSMNGSGTATFSGTATDSLVGDGVNRKSTQITCTAGTLTITVSGAITDAQLELVEGQSNQNPSEYVSSDVLSAPFHGANVDSVKYFTTENGNTVTSNIVTEATGADISDAILKGALLEELRTNLFLNADVPVTQVVTVLNATNYTIQVIGTGSITLSGAGSGVVTEGNPITITTSSTSLTCTASGSLDYAQVEQGDFATSIIVSGGSTTTRNADLLDIDMVNFPQSFSILMSVTPIADGADSADAEFALFGPDDRGGIVDEVYTDGGVAYGYTHATGGGKFTLITPDFSKDTRTKIGFSLSQEGSNVRAIIVKDGVEKLNTATAGTLVHIDTGTLQIGRYNASSFSTNCRDVQLYRRGLNTSQIQANQFDYFIDELGNVEVDELGNKYGGYN